MPDKRPTTLIIFRQPPYASDISKSGIDYALAAAVFEQAISCLFMGKGVLQLLAEQNPKTIQQKNIEKVLQAFAMYDIDKLYIDAQALKQYQLKQEQLYINGQAINEQDIQNLIQEHQQILSF